MRGSEGCGPTDGGVSDTVDDLHVLDAAFEGEALCALTALPVRQRTGPQPEDRWLQLKDIRTLTRRRTYTNVNKSLVKARAGIRRARTPGL